MNIQEIISKMDSKMLREGLLQISKGLTPEQLKQAETVIKGSGKAAGLDGGDLSSIHKQLQNNPEMLKRLASDPEIVAKLEKIIKK